MLNRAHVAGYTSKLARERSQRCSLCGEPFDRDEPVAYAEHEHSGGVAMPVHVECSQNIGNPADSRQRGSL